MEKIESISLQKLHNNEHGQYMSDCGTLLRKWDTAILGVESDFAEFENVLSDEQVAIRVEAGSPFSSELERIDHLRDNTWNAIWGRIQSTLLSPIDSEAKAAVILKRIFDIDGDVRDNPYSEESNKLTNLVTDLQKVENLPYLNMLGVTEWVAALKTQNEQFIAVNNLRNAELAKRPSGNTKTIRKMLDSVYQTIVEKINASVVLGSAKPSAISFVGELNEQITYYKNTIAIRNGRSLKDTETNTPTAK